MKSMRMSMMRGMSFAKAHRKAMRVGGHQAPENQLETVDPENTLLCKYIEIPKDLKYETTNREKINLV